MTSEPSFKNSFVIALRKGDAALLESMLNGTENQKAILEGLQANISVWGEEQILKDETTLNKIIDCIRVLRKHNMAVDLSGLSVEPLSKIIRRLVLLKPSDAEWVLNNMGETIPPIKIFFNEIGRNEEQDLLKMEIHIFDPQESISLYNCMSKIKFSCDSYKDYLYYIIDKYMQADSDHAIKLFFFHEWMPLGFAIDFILQNDSSDVLKEFLDLLDNHWGYFDKYFRGNPNAHRKREAKINKGNLFKGAIGTNAHKSIVHLLDAVPRSSRADYILDAARGSNLLMTLALCNNDFNEAGAILFQEDIFFKDDLYDHLITMLRFSPIDMVDKTVDAYVRAGGKNKEMLLQIYSDAKRDFLKYAPAISRYTNQDALKAIKQMYGRRFFLELIGAAFHDMAYGKERGELVTQLIHGMKESKENSLFSPTRAELLNLPPSKEGSRIFSAMLEKISNYNTKKNLKPNENKNESPFYRLNTKHDSVTRLSKYQWAKPLVSAVFHHSKSKQITQYPNLDKVYDAAIKAEHDCLYSLKYKNKIINNVMIMPHLGGVTCGHGRLPAESTIGDIENLISQMMQAKLKVSGADEKEQRAYNERLTKFYEQAAELVWLIGNTQPFERGSGSVAELTLQAIFEFHGLQAPILKPEFPQLDVLDIIFPLDDYIKLFPYFFEPSTLPEHLRKPVLSNMSVNKQIVEFYKEINSVSQEEERKDKWEEKPNEAPESKLMQFSNISANQQPLLPIKPKRPPPPPPKPKRPPPPPKR